MRQKFATQVEPQLLAEIRRIAGEDGRQLQSVVEEAFRAYVDERRRAKPRASIMAHHDNSHERFASLYERLAR